MSKITHRLIDGSDVPSPPEGCVTIFTDLDSLLKMKNEDGEIIAIGGKPLEFQIGIESPSPESVITHNLGKVPNIAVVDSDGDSVPFTYTLDSEDPMNVLTLNFDDSVTGVAYIS